MKQNKKKLIGGGFLIGLSFLFLGSRADASINYERIPAGISISSPVEINFSFDDYYLDLQSTTCPDNCLDADDEYFKICIQGDTTGEFCGNFYASTTKSISEQFSLPLGKYNYVYLNGSPDGLNGTGGALNFEGDGPSVIFTIASIPNPNAGNIINLPADAVSSTRGVVGDTLNSIWIFIELAIGVPLAFLIVKKWLNLMP